MTTETSFQSYVETLTIEPIPPDTVASIRYEVIKEFELALKKAEKEELLNNKEIQLSIEKTFPTDEVVVVIVTLASNVALKTFEEFVIPELKKKYKTWRKRREKRNKKK